MKTVLLTISVMFCCFSVISVQMDAGDDPEVVRAKYFIRDEFLVSIPAANA